jgi:hypothetical protein
MTLDRRKSRVSEIRIGFGGAERLSVERKPGRAAESIQTERRVIAERRREHGG